MSDVYIAGGKLYFKKKGAVAYTLFAGVAEAKINTKVEYAKAYDHSTATKVLSKQVPKSFDATLSFKTDDISPKNIAMLIYGTSSTIALHDDAEAGWVDASVTKIEAGKELLIEGAFKFVSENASGNEMVLEVFNASVSATGDFNLQSEDVAEIGFEGAVLLTDVGGESKYFDWYVKD